MTFVPGTSRMCTNAGVLKSPVAKALADVPQMGANRLDADGIVPVPLKLDAPAIGQVIELVDRRILIDAHGGLAALLHGGEAGVLGGCQRDEPDDENQRRCEKGASGHG